MKKVLFLSVLLPVIFLFTTKAQEIKKVSPELKQMTSEFDRLLSEQFKPGETGCAALVAKNGQIIYKKAFGMANLELNVPMQPDMVFRIGSITKQFTAVSILQLMEQGKLSLQDDIRKFISDYPTQAYNITIENLLTHTSGIKSYTNVPEFQKYVREDKTPQEAIDMFRNLPMEFAPGTKWNYNNSGFFLLGYIIEKITGKTYAEYVEENIFKPAGMTNSCYGSDTKLIKNRAYPYKPDGNGFANADYLSMKLPYSAGALMSTVEDLYKWNRALISGKLIKKESLDKAFTEYKLTSGKGTGYGYGWFIKELQGSRTIEHGGGINGYLTNSIYLPAEDVFVAVFSNNEGKAPEMVSTKMAAIAIGKPWNYKEIPLDKTTIDAFAGIYEDEDKNQRTIIPDGDKLFSQRPGSPMYRILPFEKDKFYFNDSFTTVAFSRDASGKVISCVTDDRGVKTAWIKTEKAIPVHTEIKLSPDILSKYAGDYELAPGFLITVTTEGDRLFTQATGQGRVEAFAESETKFFLKIVDANFEFVKDDSGKYKFVLHQGGMTMEGKKVR